MTTETQTIIDNGDLCRYRTELPNMCDDDLDPYQYRLYAHYNAGAAPTAEPSPKACRNRRRLPHERNEGHRDANG